jgi:ribosomal protein S18 acetylase RimI-like enzyme
MNAATPPVRIVPAHERHRQFVRRLSAEVFSRFGSYDETLPAMMEWPWIRTLVAETGNRTVGFAMISFEDLLAGEIDLAAIAVDPEWQSRGIGTALLDHVERLARSVVARGRQASVRLTVAEDNRPARKLFQGRGFRIVPGREDRYSGGQRSLLLRKHLPDPNL